LSCFGKVQQEFCLDLQWLFSYELHLACVSYVNMKCSSGIHLAIAVGLCGPRILR
jgi:hypothetical protein